MISSGGRTRSSVDYSFGLQGINKKIEPGTTYDFNFQATVPTNIVNYTAIGTVTARYFVIQLYTEYGCCANTAYATLHVILHSKTPRIMNKPQIQKPSNWYPQ